MANTETKIWLNQEPKGHHPFWAWLYRNTQVKTENIIIDRFSCWIENDNHPISGRICMTLTHFDAAKLKMRWPDFIVDQQPATQTEIDAFQKAIKERLLNDVVNEMAMQLRKKVDEETIKQIVFYAPPSPDKKHG